MTEQPSLFPGSDSISVEPKDIADIARRISESAGDRGLQVAAERDDRVASGAQADLGGQRAPADGQIVEPATPSAALEVRPLELPGSNGRRNPGEQPLTPAQAQKGLTDAAIDEQAVINRQGAQRARDALRGV